MAATAVDRITVADGFSATAFMAWVEPVGVAGNMPAFKDDASNSAVDQALQMGMHHDGMHVFALEGSRRGLLVMNHEYTDDGLLHVGGLANWSAEKVAKNQAAHGVSVAEIESQGRWLAARAAQPLRTPLHRQHALCHPSETVNHHSLDVCNACKPSVGSPTGRPMAP